MKSGTKPARGCAASGFTFVDASGSLVQLSWSDLRRRGEALFVFDGVRWRRVRSTAALPTGDRLYRFSIGPTDATSAMLEQRSVLLPGEALSGGFAAAVARARMVAGLPRSLAAESNLWQELGPLDRELVSLLRNRHEGTSDADLVAFLATGRLGGATLADFLPGGRSSWAERITVPADVLAKLTVEELRDLALLAETMAQKADQRYERGFSPSAESLLGLVANFLDAPDPVVAALHATYGVPEGSRWQVVNAVRLLQSLGVATDEAFSLAGELGVDTPSLLLDLVDLHLRWHPGDVAGVRSVVSEFRLDPAAAVKEHGTVFLDFSLRFPSLSPAAVGALVEGCGVNPFDRVSPASERLLAAFDPDTFAELQRLIPDERLLLSVAGPLLSTFAKRAPEWLMRSSTSPEIDRARLLARLPDADTAVRRRRQLEETLSTPPLSAGERAFRAEQAEVLSRIASGVDPAAALQEVGIATVVALLPDAPQLRKRAKQLEVAGDDSSLRYASLLRRFDAARERGDQVEMSRLAVEIAVADDLVVTLLPAGKQLTREIERARSDALGEEDLRRRESLEQEYALWSAYAAAFVAGDDAELLRVGALLRPDREPPGGRVSIHDAAYWLPVSSDAATAPDGSGFGEWLLTDDRGISALRSDAGRRSLGSAALEWQSNGGGRAQIKDLADRAATRNFGGHMDPVTLFFAANKISPESATETLAAVRRSELVPTPFPLDSVFHDEASGLRGYFLPRTDPRGVQLGVLTDCCQHPASAGRSCAFMGQEHPSGGFFVVEDAAGVVVAQSWVWAGTSADGTVSGAVFDNIEARLSGVSDGRTSGVLSVYDKASSALGERFDLVTVGATSDVPLDSFPSLDKGSAPSLDSVGYHGYSDASTHRVLHRGTPSVRFAGREGGFEISEGDCKVFVDAQGRVHCRDETGAELARRALAGSTPREYEVVWSSADDLLLVGEPSGIRFVAGTTSTAGWSPDMTTTPESYTKVSDELLEVMRKAGVDDPDTAAAYLKVAGFDGRRAEQLVLSGWMPTELQGMRQPYISMPSELRGLHPSSPARQRFLQLSSTAPLLAQALLHRDIAREDGSDADFLPELDSAVFRAVPPAGLVMLANCRDEELRNCMRAALVGPAPGDFGGNIGAGLLSVARHNQAAVNSNLQEAVLAARELSDAGLSADEVGALHLFRSLSTAELPPALLSREERALWMRLPAEDRQLTVDRVCKASEWTGGLRPYSLSSWAALPKELSQEDVNLLAATDPYAPTRALAVAHALGAESQVDRGQAERGPGLPAGSGEILKSYREKIRYVRGDLDDLTGEQVIQIAKLDVLPLVEALEEIGMRRNFGENMPEFTFMGESIPALASLGGEGVRSLGRKFICDDASTEDIAVIAAAGVDVDALGGLDFQNGASGARLRAEVVGRALRAGVEPQQVDALARSGVSAELVAVALHVPSVRQRSLDREPDHELLEGLAGWVCEGGGYSWGFGGEMPTEELNVLLDLAERSPEDRATLLTALRSADGERLSFRDLLGVMPSSADLFASLGGLRAAPDLYL